MRLSIVYACFLLSSVEAFTSLSPRQSTLVLRSPECSSRMTASLAATAATASSEGDASLSPAEKEKKERKSLVRREGGLFAFNTKYGALNPFAIYYGLVAIILGIPWFFALTACQFLYLITGNRFDRQRFLPTFISHMWGVSLLRLTRCYPKMDNVEILRKFYKEKRPAMFVANHNSWMDIPFLGASIGWRNYKIIAKKELRKVPILGKSIEVSGHVMLDRSNRRSQLKTLKTGMQYLEDGVHLCTFPEGTRSRSGRLMKFKNGAFKMAHKVGAPIIPLSIVGASKVHPPHWMFPLRSAHKIAHVVIHEPVESKGKTEDELAAEVRKAMISGLPPDQLPEEEA